MAALVLLLLAILVYVLGIVLNDVVVDRRPIVYGPVVKGVDE